MLTFNVHELRRTTVRLVVPILIALWLVLTPQQRTHAAVQTCDETGLDAAIAAGGSHTFNCAGPTTIITSGSKTIPNGVNVTLDGGGLLTVSGNNSHVVFRVEPGAALTLENIVVSDGTATPGGGAGGGIYNIGGELTITDSTVTNNSADGGGGGIFNGVDGTTTITRSTLSGNTAIDHVGGGILSHGSLTVTNSTISGNSAGTVGGGIGVSRGTVTITYSTISGNSAGDGGGVFVTTLGEVNISNSIVTNSVGGDCTGGGVYNANNNRGTGACGTLAVTGLDPNLANNSGATMTHALMSGSNAIDMAVNCPPPNIDQRGVTRPQGAACDIGAFELVNQPPTANAGGPYQVDEGGSVGLNGSGTDPEGSTLTYAWDLDNNGTFESAGQTPTFSAVGRDGPDGQTIVLQVCDSGGLCSTDSTTVTIDNVAPTVNAGPDASILSVDTFQLLATFTDPGTPDTHTASIDWGDGTNDAGTVNQNANTVTGSHEYASGGNYDVEVCVEDDDGGVGCDSLTLEVVPCGPPGQTGTVPPGPPGCVPPGFEPPGANPPGQSGGGPPAPPPPPQQGPPSDPPGQSGKVSQDPPGQKPGRSHNPPGRSRRD